MTNEEHDVARTKEGFEDYVCNRFREGDSRMNDLAAMMNAHMRVTQEALNEVRVGNAMTGAAIEGIQVSIAAIEANNSMTEEGRKDQKTILEGFASLKGGIRVLGWFEKPAKWLAAILAAGTAVGAFLHLTGRGPFH